MAKRKRKKERRKRLELVTRVISGDTIDGKFRNITLQQRMGGRNV